MFGVPGHESYTWRTQLTHRNVRWRCAAHYLHCSFLEGAACQHMTCILINTFSPIQMSLSFETRPRLGPHGCPLKTFLSLECISDELWWTVGMYRVTGNGHSVTCTE